METITTILMFAATIAVFGYVAIDEIRTFKKDKRVQKRRHYRATHKFRRRYTIADSY